MHHNADSLVEVVFETAAIRSLQQNNGRMLLASIDINNNLNVVESPMEAIPCEEPFVSCLVAVAGEQADVRVTKGEPLVVLRMGTDVDARLVAEYHSVSAFGDCIPGQGRAQPIGMCGKMACCHHQPPKANDEGGGADEYVPLSDVSLETQRRSAPSSEECGQV